MIGQIEIIQFNCGRSNHKITRPFLDAAAPETQIVLAIQEPAYNNRTKTTYCPRGYALAFDADPMTKVCFMVSRSLHASQWSYQSHSRNVASLHMEIQDQRQLTIINVYNPRGTGPRTQAWEAITQALDQAEGEIILLGDFNSHHPAWGGLQAATEPQAEHLWIETRRAGLSLLTPIGEATWKRGRQES